MKIKNLSCTQFAGIRDRNVAFSDGVNIVYGKNESGKSTLVNLISRLFFQDARIDLRSDKEFRQLYFPGVKKGSNIVGDYADGKITLETENGTYTLTKEWGDDSRCTLSTPDGVIRDQKTIDSILKESLIYREGVYSDLLFSSQRNTDISLQTILDASKKTDAKQEIADAVTLAFAQSDGVSVDAIEQAIRAKIDEIEGKHWDNEKCIPIRKVGRWSNGLGEILKAYYAMEDANEVVEEIRKFESEADIASKDYIEKDKAVKIAQEKFDSFNVFAGRLAAQTERKKTLERLEADKRKIAGILAEWPSLSQRLEKAKALQIEKNSRTLLDKYENAKAIIDEMNALDLNLMQQPCPQETEISQVKNAQRTVSSLENKLCGMNIQADIKSLGANDAEITLLRTGEKIEISDGSATISEAVRITVPGVLEMQLSPANIDVAAVEKQISEQKIILAEILEKYNVKTVEELENLARTIENVKSKYERINSRLTVSLGDISFEELESKVTAVDTPVRSAETIENEIFDICRTNDVASYITSRETIMESYVSEYGSINDLKAKAFDLDAEIAKTKESVAGTENIPEEYASVTDPDSYLAQLQNNLKNRQSICEEALAMKAAAASRLERYKQSATDDPAEDAANAKRVFEEQKTLLEHWHHIYDVFCQQKESVNDNPMKDVADRFTYYLGAITSGRVSSEFPEADKLNMNIYSDNRLLDYGKLSEGTKETVSLAFRLAVLDHLFPEGGGVIVFDDPFTDMDADRSKQSCSLIKECSKRHQVIFLTCREEYANMLEGNLIEI